MQQHPGLFEGRIRFDECRFDERARISICDLFFSGRGTARPADLNPYNVYTRLIGLTGGAVSSGSFGSGNGELGDIKA